MATSTSDAHDGNPHDEVRQIVIHPVAWDKVVNLIETAMPNIRITPAPPPLQVDGDIPTYFMTLKETRDGH